MFGFWIIFIVITSCAAHKYKSHIKPCDCPDNNENPKNKRHTEYKLHFKGTDCTENIFRNGIFTMNNFTDMDFLS